MAHEINTSKIITEVVVFSVESAVAAQQGGAQRVELCDNMAEGGTTPSSGTIAIARKYLNIDLNVMIRPRGGDFLYSDIEFEIMQSDIEHCKSLGVNGVVFGILNSNGAVDKKRCKQLVEQAKPMSVTFHRAFDMSNNPSQALEDIITCGFSRILTSGQQSLAQEGIDLLTALVKQANQRICIMPGGGVRITNVLELIQKTGATEFHTSARNIYQSAMIYRNKHLKMGSTISFDEYEIQGLDVGTVKQFVETLKNIK